MTPTLPASLRPVPRRHYHVPEPKKRLALRIARATDATTAAYIFSVSTRAVTHWLAGRNIKRLTAPDH